MNRTETLVPIALVVFMAVGMSCAPPKNTRTRQYRTPIPELHDVVYRIQVHTINECVPFSTTYETTDGTAQKDVCATREQNVVYQFKAKKGQFVYLSVQNTGHRNNNLIFACEILIDRKVFKTVESVGFAKIASCSGSLN